MKTYKNLFREIVLFENLLLAARKAARGKRERIYVMAFFEKLEENLFTLREQLIGKTYTPGNYSTFHIYRPKPRMISAAPFRDRVVHHALMNIVAPLLERSFIYDSYANRVDKGTHRAIFRYQTFLRKYDYVLKCDLRKYFPSIDHEILKSLIRKKISDNDTLWLIDRIIDRSNLQDTVVDYYLGDNLLTPLQRRKGLPIGNLTSQFFANLYLNPLDHFVKDILRCPAYLRYVDDFALFSDSKGQLKVWKEDIARFLEKYRLRLHPRRCHIILSQTGSRFLGQVIFRSHRRLCGENVRRFKKRLREWQHHPPDNLQQCICSWIGHARQANTAALLKALSKVHKTMFNFISP